MKRRNFSPEFKRESAQLVVDQNYTVSDAAKAMDVGLSTISLGITARSGCMNITVGYHLTNQKTILEKR